MKKNYIILVFCLILLLFALSSCDLHVHKYTEWNTIKEPTCTEAGLKESVCSCGEKTTKEIPALGHDSKSIDGIEPTCTQPGKEATNVCSRCGVALGGGNTIPALGHDEKIVEKIEPSCIKTGKEASVVCSRCGITISGGNSIPSLGHSWGEWTISKEPTCTNDGERKHKCTICGFISSEKVKATGHKYENRICTICGEYEPSEGLAYVQDGSRIIITGIGSCKDSLLVIPKTIDGLPVYAIGESAFANCYNITEVIMFDNIISIGQNAFADCFYIERITLSNRLNVIPKDCFRYCTNLVDITLPSSLTTIFEEAFISCKSLEKITIPDKVKAIDVGTFKRCTSLAIVELPKNLSHIYNEAFYDCLSLTNIKLPSGLTVISQSAFENCESLTHIELPEGLLNIHENAFKGCTALYKVTNYSNKDVDFGETYNGCIGLYAKIVVNKDGTIKNIDGEKQYFETEDNFLFEYDPASILSSKYTLIAYLGDSETVTLPVSFDEKEYIIRFVKGVRNVIVPTSFTKITRNAFAECYCLKNITLEGDVTSIDEYAFYDCDNLECISLPSTIKSLGNYSFKSCSKLKSISLSVEITKIENETFKNCSSLETINYLGTTSNWSKISLAEKWNYGMPDLTVVCVDGQLVVKSIS